MKAALPEDLINRIAVYGDALAYKRFFLFYYPRLLSFSQSIIRDRESAEEVVSDVFTKVWSQRERLPEIEHVHLYLYVITKNLSINRLEKENRVKSYSLNEISPEFSSMTYNPEELMITSEMFRKVEAAIRSLPPRCQLIFKLVKEDALSYKEVASLLHLSVKTVDNQMTIAIKKIGRAIPFKGKKTILL